MPRLPGISTQGKLPAVWEMPASVEAGPASVEAGPASVEA